MSDEVKLVWPEKVKCHGESPAFAQHATQWRPAEPNGRDALDPYGRQFRTCSYCGCIHPEDLFNLLFVHETVKLGGSDWKYGWPHKFYVEGIPNPKAGQTVSVSSMGCSSRADAEKEAKRYPNKEYKIVEKKEETIRYEDGVEVRRYERTDFDVRWLEKAPANTHAKWYNEHILDIEDEHTRNVFCQTLLKYSGIDFTVEDGKLKYAAPSRGYQR